MHPFVLIILDGWGWRADPTHNAMAGTTPFWDSLLENFPHTLLLTHGDSVGLAASQMGNSEVGHLNIGAGRIVYQDVTRIQHAIAHHTLKNLPNLKPGSTLHLIGLLSPGGVHSDEQQLFHFIELAEAAGVSHIYIHAILDGRDVPPRSAESSLERLEQVLQRCPHAQLSSIVGRFYAMDRDKRWERIAPVHHFLVTGAAPFSADTGKAALAQAYARNESDEFVQITRIGHSLHPIQNHDTIWFANFRADRARQLCYALKQKDFAGFPRTKNPEITLITLTQYAPDLADLVLFPPVFLRNTIGEYLSNHGLKQLRIAETEKYAHVTFFFNGGIEAPFKNEDRELIASLKVATYDLAPSMCAPEITDAIIRSIEAGKHDFIVVNYANADMVGHTGNFEAAQQAVHCLDNCLAKLIPVLLTHQGQAIITADHGNAECMFDPDSGQAHTAHTLEPVPCVYISNRKAHFKGQGILADVAPTILACMGLPAPPEMTQTSLLFFEETHT